jgi:hypothetical protein
MAKHYPPFVNAENYLAKNVSRTLNTLDGYTAFSRVSLVSILTRIPSRKTLLLHTKNIPKVYQTWFPYLRSYTYLPNHKLLFIRRTITSQMLCTPGKPSKAQCQICFASLSGGYTKIWYNFDILFIPSSDHSPFQVVYLELLKPNPKFS